MSTTIDPRKGLTNSQTEAFDKMVKFIKSNQTMFFLGGYAGTGKTYTIVRLIKYLLSDKSGSYRIGMSAPTNKAVRVLRTFMSMVDRRVDFATIHSMLGLKEKINRQGEIYFAQDKYSVVSITDYALLIIDEVSMLGSELFGYLEKYNVKIIFMGDPAQIPPVKQEDSIPMTEKGRKEYGIESHMLTEIMRQKEGNPLIEMTLSIRENLESSASIRIPKVKKVNGVGLEFIDGYDDARITELFIEHFVCDEFKEDADHAKVIAWMNRTVDNYNGKIRVLIYGEFNKKVEIGEKLIANKPLFNSEEVIIFNTNDEFEVTEIKVLEAEVKGRTLKYYETRVEYDNYFTGRRENKLIHILHEDSEADHTDILRKLKMNATGCTPGTDLARKGWVAFYKFLKVFADVKYAYAITAHKSQGSTYKNVILVESDINFNKRIVERNRIKYTAASRPSDNLYIIN